MNKFTQEDLVKYLYRETSPQKTAAINAALITDYELKESLQKLESAQQNLEIIEHFSPSENSINKILEYASCKQRKVHSI